MACLASLRRRIGLIGLALLLGGLLASPASELDAHTTVTAPPRASAHLAIVSPAVGKPDLAISPEAGPSFTEFTIAAGGFLPGETITRWVTGPGGTNASLGAITLSRQESGFVRALTAGYAAPGAYVYHALGSRNRTTITVSFAILPHAKPQLHQYSATAPRHQCHFIYLRGFKPNQPFTSYLVQPDSTAAGAVSYTTGPYGEFTLQYQPGDQTNLGLWSIVVVADGGLVLSLAFEVVASAGAAAQASTADVLRPADEAC